MAAQACYITAENTTTLRVAFNHKHITSRPGVTSELREQGELLLGNGCETWSLTLREERKLRVFENMVLRIIFGPRRDEVMGEWRRLHNEELNDLYSSPNIVRVIKSRRMRWAGHVARMGEERECIWSWWGNRREGDHRRDLGVDGWVILGWMSRRWDVGIWTGLGWPRIETVGGRL